MHQRTQSTVKRQPAAFLPVSSSVPKELGKLPLILTITEKKLKKLFGDDNVYALQSHFPFNGNMSPNYRIFQTI